MQKIGILYICTGRYDIFWKDFYISSEQYLLKNSQIHYFVFTDADYIFDEEKNTRIHKIFQENLGWPGNTLMRFHMFLGQKEKLKFMDYLYFFNANLELKTYITDEILPEDTEIVVTQHPGFSNKNRNKFTYEQNHNSTAYISEGEGIVYVAGGLIGGAASKFLEMCEDLATKIDIDIKNGIIAKWHDESHLNKYIISHAYKLLDPGYLYPEGGKIPFECKVMIRDKRKNKAFGSYYYKQGRPLSLLSKVLSFFRI